MTSDPSYGIGYLRRLFEWCGLGDRWSYLAEDGAVHGLPRERLKELCRECDLYVNLSNVNWLPELEECRRRILIDTDPVFTQIRAHGLDGCFDRYHGLFTYGENVDRPGCTMPTGGAAWLPTRQPLVLDLWPVEDGRASAPFTTVMNWSPLGDCEYRGRIYGQKDREFEPFFDLPRRAGEPMEIAVKVPDPVGRRLAEGGWRIVDPEALTRDPWSYQRYMRASRAEFSVAKHGYVSTSSGWFSERTAGYLASGRPALVQDTGFTRWLPAGAGVIAFRDPEEALAGVEEVKRRYPYHCREARAVAREYFEAGKVLGEVLDRAMSR
jgi:hypothetical protein